MFGVSTSFLLLSKFFHLLGWFCLWWKMMNSEGNSMGCLVIGLTGVLLLTRKHQIWLPTTVHLELRFVRVRNRVHLEYLTVTVSVSFLFIYCGDMNILQLSVVLSWLGGTRRLRRWLGYNDWEREPPVHLSPFLHYWIDPRGKLLRWAILVTD